MIPRQPLCLEQWIWTLVSGLVCFNAWGAFLYTLCYSYGYKHRWTLTALFFFILGFASDVVVGNLPFDEFYVFMGVRVCRTVCIVAFVAHVSHRIPTHLGMLGMGVAMIYNTLCHILPFSLTLHLNTMLVVCFSCFTVLFCRYHLLLLQVLTTMFLLALLALDTIQSDGCVTNTIPILVPILTAVVPLCLAYDDIEPVEPRPCVNYEEVPMTDVVEVEA